MILTVLLLGNDFNRAFTCEDALTPRMPVTPTDTAFKFKNLQFSV